MSSSPSKSSGQWNSAMGSVKESVGNTFGARNMAAKGRDQHARGEAEIHQAKAKGYAEGTVDRVSGKKDAVVGAVTGDKTQQAQGNARRDKGEAKQNWNH